MMKHNNTKINCRIGIGGGKNIYTPNRSANNNDERETFKFKRDVRPLNLKETAANVVPSARVQRTAVTWNGRYKQNLFSN